MTKFSILSVACIVAAQSGLACASDADSPPPAGGGGGGVSAADDGGVLTLTDSLTDSEMLKVIDVASKGEIERSSIAENRAQNPAVRAFASKLVADYTIIDYSAAVTANTIGLTPSTSEVATMVTRTGDAVMQGMATMPVSADFDRRYLDIQIEADTGMLAMVERMLIYAEGAPLRSLLSETLQASQRHLDEANLIRFTLK